VNNIRLQMPDENRYYFKRFVLVYDFSSTNQFISNSNGSLGQSIAIDDEMLLKTHLI
jgi:hypothetical protein